MSFLAFTVFGVPLSKGNHRAFWKPGMKYPILTESNRNVKSWQQLVQQGASHQLQQLPASERGLLSGAVRLTIAFYLPRPKKYDKRGVFVPHVKSPDLDRLERAILDALTAVAYRDDKQVTEMIAGKYYAEVNGAAHVDIRVEAAPGQPLAFSLPLDQPLFGQEDVESGRGRLLGTQASPSCEAGARPTQRRRRA
jgi:crossover junction endodeoxyribonuclease RusA